jgi:hypothetical protein
MCAVATVLSGEQLSENATIMCNYILQVFNKSNYQSKPQLKSLYHVNNINANEGRDSLWNDTFSLQQYDRLLKGSCTDQDNNKRLKFTF